MKPITARQRQKMKELSDYNNSLRYFFFRGYNFEVVGTKIHNNGSCIHTVKNLDITDKTKKRIGTITEADLQRIRDLKK